MTKQFLRKGRSFICFSYFMFYFFLKRIIYCPWSTKLYLQAFTCICQIKVLATQMDTSWHTMAYSYHRRIPPCTEFMEDYLKHNCEQNSFICFPRHLFQHDAYVLKSQLYNCVIYSWGEEEIWLSFCLICIWNGNSYVIIMYNLCLLSKYTRSVIPSSTSLSKSKRGE